MSSLPRLSVLSAPSPPSVTYESALADAWPAVTRVIQREVHRLQVPAHAVDDLVQATAEVVLRKRPAFLDADDLAPYVRIVARHKALRWARRTARETVGLPELPASQSVSEAARMRLRAAGTLQAYERLEPVERDRLSRYLAGERAGSSIERARERKRIERIRTHMAQAIERIAAMTAGWRKFLDVVTRPEVVAAAAIAVVQVITTLLGPPVTATATTLVGAGTRPTGVLVPPPAPPELRPAPALSPPQHQATTRVERPRELPTPIPPERGDARVVAVVSPMGGTWAVTTTPNSPDMPLLCIRSAVDVCVDKPFTL